MAIGTFKSSSHNMSLVQEQLLHAVIILLSLWFVDCVICSQSVVIKCTTAFIFSYGGFESLRYLLWLSLPPLPDPRINPSVFLWFPCSIKQRSPLPLHRNVQTHSLCDWFHLDIVPSCGCVSIPWLAGGPSSGGWRLLSISPQSRSQLHSVFTCHSLPDTAHHNLSSLL